MESDPFGVNDDQLARRIRRGEPRAFDDLFDRHAGPLLRYLTGMTGSRPVAEDLLQETMLSIYRHIDHYEERGAFRGWIYRIATNQALSHLRRRRTVESAGVVDPDSLPTGAPSDALDRLQGAEEAEAARRAVATLPAEQRAVLMLRINGELSIEEIARALEIPTGTVKSRLHYAIARLREVAARPCSETPEDLTGRTVGAARRSHHDA